MRTTTLGRTGIQTTVLGLGAGGPSRIGQHANASESESVGVVRRAIDLGMTFVDTAEGYRTEEIVGKALADHPDSGNVVVSTKFTPEKENEVRKPEEIEKSLDESLARLRRDRIDIYHAHGVLPDLYPQVRDRLYPVLDRMREKGKIGHIGITERFGSDSSHAMLDAAVRDDLWDVVMVGFNMLNPSARSLLLRTTAQNIGVLVMFAVRRAFRTMDEIAGQLDTMVASGLIEKEVLARPNPFGKALSSGECRSLSEMAYRFCLYEPGLDVVLSGTGSVDHLEENVKTADLPPLSADTLAALEELFGSIDSVSGN